jgi:hypothetical protein
MSLQIFIDWVFVIGCAILIVAPFPPFERKRVRARWAIAAIVCMGLLGVAKGVVCLTFDAGWHGFTRSQSWLIDDLVRWLYDGFAAGIIVALLFSGQLRGTKRDINHAT